MPTAERSHRPRPGARPRGERGAVGRLIAFVLTVAVVVVGVGVMMDRGIGPFPTPEGCTARVEGLDVELDPEQAQNAAIIGAVGVRRGLPARAVSIALAAAFQESKLHNLTHGDRDSVGLFQQRPSQGWGTAQQIANPYYAANRFYDELEKVHGFATMRITDAAQQVQRSGYPEAYQAHAQDARAVASALTGYSPADFSCVVHGPKGLSPQGVRGAGLTARAAAVRHDLRRAFGPLSIGGASHHGRAFDVFVRPRSPDNIRKGWVIAQYMVAQAARLDINHVAFDHRIWSTGKLSEKGWRRVGPGRGSGVPAALRHADRVHVDVVG